jgi:hypothetical protein
MENQEANRAGGRDLRANVWLNRAVIIALILAALYHAVHAWDGGSKLAAAWAILDVACIYLLSLNISRRQNQENKRRIQAAVRQTPLQK